MPQLAPLNPESHSNLRVNAGINVSRLRGQQMVPLVVHEFAPAGCDLPVLFVKNADTGQFQAIGLLGLKPGENLMLMRDDWLGNYVPGVLSNDPFRLMTGEEDSANMVMGIDEASPLVSSTEGERLFDDAGELTPYLERRRDALVQYAEHTEMTRQFVSHLVELDLLQQQTLNLDVAGEPTILNGIYLVNEQRLQALPQDRIQELFRRGFLRAIYSHLMSLQQVQRLARLKAAGKAN